MKHTADGRRIQHTRYPGTTNTFVEGHRNCMAFGNVSCRDLIGERREPSTPVGTAVVKAPYTGLVAYVSASPNATPALSFSEMIGSGTSGQATPIVVSFHRIDRSCCGA